MYIDLDIYKSFKIFAYYLNQLLELLNQLLELLIIPTFLKPIKYFKVSIYSSIMIYKMH